MQIGDIDIDFKNRSDILKIIDHIPASIISNQKLKKHNTAIYAQQIPTDKESGLASLDYKTAENFGYYKIDFLNISAYQNIKNEEHLISLLEKEPDWDLFLNEEIVSQLFQLHSHFHVVKEMNPRNIHELAMLLALIRPGKRYLIGMDWPSIEKEIWKPIKAEEYQFKKSHAYAYASLIIVQLNSIIEQM